MDKNRINELITIYRDGLLNDTLVFWQKHSPDRKYGGFLTFLDADGTVVGSDKQIWAQGRISWVFSKLYNTVEKRQEWLDLAKHGIDFLLKYAFDKDGRMFYSVTREGKPLRKRRYTFSECFAVVAFAEYAKATGDKEFAKRADDLFKLIIRYNFTPGLLESKLIPQTRQLKSHALPMILISIIQILRQVKDDPAYKKVIDDSLFEIEYHFMKPEFKALLESVGPNGEFIDEPMGRTVNPGHAIETSWFIMEEARYRKDKSLVDLACRILDWSLDIGWDDKYGGIYYFRDVKGFPCEQYEHDMKLWWPHNEAIYATLLAHYLTGDNKYEQWHKKIHDWAYSHFPDTKNGGWFGYLHRDGSLSVPLKGNMWQGPFHLSRMQLYCWKLLEEMRDSAN
jgi:N-acylglucosamine 2-epimerase